MMTRRIGCGWVRWGEGGGIAGLDSWTSVAGGDCDLEFVMDGLWVA